MLGSGVTPPTPPPFDCQAYAACCSFAPAWPRFSTEADADLDIIPEKFVAADLSGMRCDGARCSALVGRVGTATSCAVYTLRPEVCRACVPGGDDCLMARRGHGLDADSVVAPEGDPASDPEEIGTPVSTSVG